MDVPHSLVEIVTSDRERGGEGRGTKCLYSNEIGVQTIVIYCPYCTIHNP